MDLGSPNQSVVRRCPARPGFLGSVAIFTMEAQRPQRVLCVGSSGARISSRVFRLVRDYIPGAVTLPVVAAFLPEARDRRF